MRSMLHRITKQRLTNNMKKDKKKIKYRTGDVILLKEHAFTKQQAFEIAKRLRKPVIMLRDFSDLSSISRAELTRLLKR